MSQGSLVFCWLPEISFREEKKKKQPYIMEAREANGSQCSQAPQWELK